MEHAVAIDGHIRADSGAAVHGSHMAQQSAPERAGYHSGGPPEVLHRQYICALSTNVCSAPGNFTEARVLSIYIAKTCLQTLGTNTGYARPEAGKQAGRPCNLAHCASGSCWCVDRTQSDLRPAFPCSLDRLPRLAAQCLSWPGVLSAAVIVPANPPRCCCPLLSAARRAEPEALQELDAFFRAAESAGKCRLDLTAVIEAPTVACADPPLSPPPSGRGLGGGLYPINAVRNAALARCTTRLALLLDVDFLVPPSLQASALASLCAAFRVVRSRASALARCAIHTPILTFASL